MTQTFTKTTVLLTVLWDGRVDVCVYEAGQVDGQRITIAAWADVMRMFAPDCAVRVRVESGR